jgi:hypothetical protein
MVTNFVAGHQDSAKTYPVTFREGEDCEDSEDSDVGSSNLIARSQNGNLESLKAYW